MSTGAEDLDAMELRLRKEFLAGAGPVEWLVTALSMNYDGAGGLIDWMSSHPRLDRATASALYWYSQPGYYQRFAAEDEVPDVDRPGWAVARRLQERILAGDVLPPGAAFDPGNDLSTPTGDAGHPGEDWAADALTDEDGAVWAIPPAMSEAVAGPELDVRGYVEAQGWEEGMPPSVLAVLEQAWDEEEDD